MYLHPIVLAIVLLTIVLMLVLIVALMKDRNEAIEISNTTFEMATSYQSLLAELAELHLKALDEVLAKDEQLEDLHLRNAELSAAYASTTEGKAALAFDEHVEAAIAVSAPSADEAVQLELALMGEAE